MRIRATKPEFWTSKTIAALPWDVRLVLKGLESYVDDNGVGKDDLALIASDVFPRDLVASPPETLARLSEAISALSDAGLIARYEVDGEDLIYIDKWNKLQRIDKPAKGRFRRPDGTLEYAEDVDRDTYRSPRDTLASPPEIPAPVTGEQGNRGTGEQNSSPPAVADSGPTRFDEFWDTYAYKLKRVDAEKAWSKAVRKTDPDRIIAAAAAYVASLAARGDKAPDQAHAASWLNGERWDDELPTNVHQLRTDDQGRQVLPPLPGTSPWSN